MMNGPGLFDNSFKLDNAPQQRKRKFKIFDAKQHPQPNHPPAGVEAPLQRRELALTKPVDMVKIQPKTVLQREFYSEGGEEDELCLLSVRMDEYETVRSDRFCATDCFRHLPTPSTLIKDHRLVINEAGALYQSVQEVRHTHGGLQAGFQGLSSSISLVQGCMRQTEEASLESQAKIDQIKRILEGAALDQTTWDCKLAELNRRLATIERGLSEQLRVFEEDEGQRVEVEESEMGVGEGEQEQEEEEQEQEEEEQQQEGEEDEFVETHYLPAELISKLLQERRNKTRIQAEALIQAKMEAERTAHRVKQALKLFHPIFRIGDYEYQRLLQFLREEFPAYDGKIQLQLVFRRGTTDLDAEAVGQKEELEYRGNLLFVVKASTGRRIGGFISSCLLEGESMEDQHAFLFTLEEGCHKLPVKTECAGEAFSCSRHYLVAFSSDLMISANCLEEENYCEWPSSYAPLLQHTNTWLAGDFEFMIEHIEIFEVLLS